MRLTTKLLGFLNRVFNKDPGSALALRLSYDGGMSWAVSNGVLTTTVSGGSGVALYVDLSGYTIATLAAYLSGLAGYSVPFVTDDSSLLGLSARALLDGGADISTSNGDHISAYTSVLWAWIEPVAYELGVAETNIGQAPRQMSVPTAEGEWLDELGDYYAVTRIDGETDAQYATRMIAGIGKPLGNNVAMESAINTVTGGLLAKVTDAPAQAFTSPYAGTSYGLFDVVYSIALDGSDTFDTYAARVRAVVDAYRDAGTHMRTLSVSGDLSDTYATSTIADSGLAIGLGYDASETITLEGKRHNGMWRRDGSFNPLYDGTYASDGTIYYGLSTGAPITFNNSGEVLQITITNGSGVQPAEEI